MTRARALELCARFPPRGTQARKSKLALEWVKCAKVCCAEDDAKGHGPYWRLRVPGLRRLIHVGREERKIEIEQAWALFEAEYSAACAQLEKTPAAKRVRELEAIADAGRGVHKVERDDDPPPSSARVAAAGGSRRH
jgi:hypothetical protein